MDLVSLFATGETLDKRGHMERLVSQVPMSIRGFENVVLVVRGMKLPRTQHYSTVDTATHRGAV